MPIEFKKYFWDTEYETLDLKKNMKYIISRLFCEGNLNAMKWIKQNYTREEIIETAKTSRRLTPITANFLKNVQLTFLYFPNKLVRPKVFIEYDWNAIKQYYIDEQINIYNEN